MSDPHTARRTPLLPPNTVSFVLLGLIVAIYLATTLLSLPIGGGLVEPTFGVLVLFGAKVSELIAAGQYWRLITATFLHAGLTHLAFNAFALFSLGPETERIYGGLRFSVLYLLSGLGGSVASYAFSPEPAVGASGAIFGLIGGLTAFYFFSRRLLGDFGQAQIRSMIFIVVINLAIGFVGQAYIDNWGHIGGLFTGLVAGSALAPRLQVDISVFPTRLIRRYPAQGLLWAVALLLVLCSAALLVKP